MATNAPLVVAPTTNALAAIAPIATAPNPSSPDRVVGSTSPVSVATSASTANSSGARPVVRKVSRRRVGHAFQRSQLALFKRNAIIKHKVEHLTLTLQALSDWVSSEFKVKVHFTTNPKILKNKEKMPLLQKKR